MNYIHTLNFCERFYKTHNKATTYVITLFRNKRFELNEMFQRNASKFAIFYV